MYVCIRNVGVYVLNIFFFSFFSLSILQNISVRRILTLGFSLYFWWVQDSCRNIFLCVQIVISIMYVYPVKEKNNFINLFPQKKSDFQVVVLMLMGVVFFGCRNCAIKTPFSLVLIYHTRCLIAVLVACTPRTHLIDSPSFVSPNTAHQVQTLIETLHKSSRKDIKISYFFNVRFNTYNKLKPNISILKII